MDDHVQKISSENIPNPLDNDIIIKNQNETSTQNLNTDSTDFENFNGGEESKFPGNVHHTGEPHMQESNVSTPSPVTDGPDDGLNPNAYTFSTMNSAALSKSPAAPAGDADSSALLLQTEDDRENAHAMQKSASGHPEKPKIATKDEENDNDARIVSDPQTPPFASKPCETGKSTAMEQVTSSTEKTGADCPFSPSAWFDPRRLHPVVEKLVYWRDPKKSGIVFGSVLLLLLSLTYFSLISIIAYVSLVALSISISFRIYKNVLQAVQKSGEGHPYKEYLEMDIDAPSERVHKVVDILIHHYNSTAKKLRSVFLVEDLIDSLKFVIMLWCMTYIGAWFNGLTLLILAYLMAFSLPKFYETNKAQIDQSLNMVCAQVNDIMAKVRAKIPLGKKVKEQ